METTAETSSGVEMFGGHIWERMLATALSHGVRPFIITMTAGIFLLAAVALHAYLTPVPLSDHAWVQNGRVYFTDGDGGYLQIDSEGRTHCWEHGVETTMGSK